MGRTTRRVPTLNVTSSSDNGFAGGGVLCAQAKQTRRQRLPGSAQRGTRSLSAVNNRGPLRCARYLLSRRIIPKAEKGFERRKATRLHQFHIDVTIFSIPRLVLGGVVKDILIPELDADLSGYIGEFIQVLYIVTPAACQFGHFAQQAGT